jgi:hypothetical protein
MMVIVPTFVTPIALLSSRNPELAYIRETGKEF